MATSAISTGIRFEGAIRHLPLKRICDIFFSLLALTLSLPLTLPLMLIIRLSSRGPAIYGQLRIGRGGRPFMCYKFRSMYANAEHRLQALLESDPALGAEWQATRKLKKDPRITRIGTFLRKTSLDELPQFLNVLKGDMSVVGPRPVVAEEIAVHYGPKANKILTVRPGITGVWQVSGRSDTSYAERVALDEYYVDHRSLWVDLKLFSKTIPVLLTRKGAY